MSCVNGDVVPSSVSAVVSDLESLALCLKGVFTNTTGVLMLVVWLITSHDIQNIREIYLLWKAFHS